MPRHSPFHPLGAALLFAACLAPAAGAQEFGATVEKSGTHSRDLYVAGGTVIVHADVRGDVVAVGGWLDVADRVSGDVLAIAGNVLINAAVSDDVRAAAHTVTVTGEIGDDAVLLGNRVVLDRGAVIHGRGLIAADTLEIDGRIERNLHVAARTVVLRGEIVGDSRITAERLELAPGALIRGDLVYTSAEPVVVSDGAEVRGATRRTGEPAPRWRLPELPWRIFFGVSLFFTAAVLMFVLPGVTASASQQLRHAPLRTLGVGALAILAAPLIAVALALSAVGAWLALLLFATWIIAIVGGYAVALIGISDLILRELGGKSTPRIAYRLATLAVTLLVVTAFSWMPFIFVLVSLTLSAAGVGTLWLKAFGSAPPVESRRTD
jgi:cytoskeletal protein CcmA (bactofilin family)